MWWFSSFLGPTCPACVHTVSQREEKHFNSIIQTANIHTRHQVETTHVTKRPNFTFSSVYSAQPQVTLSITEGEKGRPQRCSVTGLAFKTKCHSCRNCNNTSFTFNTFNVGLLMPLFLKYVSLPCLSLNFFANTACTVSLSLFFLYKRRVIE